MIILGYPGIGKSFLAQSPVIFHVRDYQGSFGVIDLESSNFVVDGKKIENWEIPYCKIALELSEYGHIVFIS